MKCKFFWLLLSLAILAVPSLAAINQTDRIHGAIADGSIVALKSNVHPAAQPQNDEGPVDPGMKLDRIVMFMQSTPAQQADMKQFLKDLQNPSSPSYHKWLTPEQYASRFGLSRNDVAKIENWLTAQGFQIVQPARGRNWIAFSGTAELVEEVFYTEIHYYNVDGVKHFANSTNPSIPQALAGIVAGFHGLDDFRLKPLNIRTRKQNGVANPFYSSGGFNNLAPSDIAAIYDVQSLYNAGYTGTGQKMVVLGQTDISTTDISEFRAGFGLSANLPTSVLVTGDTDPGQTGDLPEADLDLEWSGAVAPNASITFVIGGIAGNQGGVFDAAQYAIDNNLAPVISLSYGGCEAANVTFIPFFEPILQQASVQGQTFLASSGDDGAAACDGTYPSGPVSVATYGPSVNYPASSPEVTGVGGTEFNEGGGTYWNCNPGNLGTACGYIPEMGWNDSDTTGTGGVNGPDLAATGGGKSSCGVESNGNCTGGFPKPSWQTGTGVPADGVRDVPDVALSASANHDGYIFCSGGSCSSGIANAVNNNSIVGGTSASTPVLAGIVTLINQYVAANGGTVGLGNINQKLYQFASTATTAFHDVTTGNNIVPCQSGSTGCPGSGQFGFTAGTGYDLVTGLGSVDANELARAFAPLSTTTTLSLNPAPVGGILQGAGNPVVSAPITFTATVTTSGSGTPTGSVTFMDGSMNLGSGTLASGSASLNNVVLNGGTHSLTAVYGGDSNFPGSTSTPTAVLVTLNDPNTTAATATPNSGAYGSLVMLSAIVTATSNPSAPTGTVTFSVGSTTLGTASLTATGSTTSSASLQTTFIPTGSNTITASYNGDATYGFSNGTTSATISKASTSTGLALSSATVDAGSTVTFTATVPQPGGGAAPSGTVTFLNGSTVIGSGALSNGTATLSLVAGGGPLMAGTYNVTASYPGDTNYTSSVSSPSALAVQSFSLSSGVTINISAPGQSGMGTLMATPIAGFSGTISYSCTLVLAGATCSTAPTSGGVTVTVTTTAASSNLATPGKGSGMFYAMLLPGLFGVVLVGLRKRTYRGMHVITLLLILGLSTLWMGACGGGPSGGGGGGGGGTPTGSMHFVVMGVSGTITVTQTVTVNVQ
jgi:hypothetical protein